MICERASLLCYTYIACLLNTYRPYPKICKVSVKAATAFGFEPAVPKSYYVFGRCSDVTLRYVVCRMLIIGCCGVLSLYDIVVDIS